MPFAPASTSPYPRHLGRTNFIISLCHLRQHLLHRIHAIWGQQLFISLCHFRQHQLHRKPVPFASASTSPYPRHLGKKFQRQLQQIRLYHRHLNIRLCHLGPVPIRQAKFRDKSTILNHQHKETCIHQFQSTPSGAKYLIQSWQLKQQILVILAPTEAKNIMTTFTCATWGQKIKQRHHVNSSNAAFKQHATCYYTKSYPSKRIKFTPSGATKIHSWAMKQAVISSNARHLGPNINHSYSRNILKAINAKLRHLGPTFESLSYQAST